jgi:hypothetical protein
MNPIIKSLPQPGKDRILYASKEDTEFSAAARSYRAQNF